MRNVRYPWVYPGDFNDRVRGADLVVSGTTRSTVPQRTRVVDGVEVMVNEATIQIDRVFKGQVAQRDVKFAWFSPAPVSGSGGVIYSGPPLADFRQNRRYLVFLRSDATSYVVTMPIYQLEVQLAPASPAKMSNVSPLPKEIQDREMAQELETAALSVPPPRPGVTGEAALYFPYVVDLIGGCAEPFLRHFTRLQSKELREAAQRWLALLIEKRSTCNGEVPH
jgi:hypothetical protein